MCEHITNVKSKAAQEILFSESVAFTLFDMSEHIAKSEAAQGVLHCESVTLTTMVNK